MARTCLPYLTRFILGLLPAFALTLPGCDTGVPSLGPTGSYSIVASGNNDYGQCNVPAPNSGFVGLAAGASHSLGLK